MKNLVLLLLLISSASMYSQVEGTLTGTITDQEVYNQGIVFAEIKLKGTELKTQTNFRGNFEIKYIAPGNYTLEVRYLGYETLQIPIIINGNEITQIASSMAAKQLSLEDMSLLNTAKEETNTLNTKYPKTQ